jgi:hypothetical protein
MRSRHSLQWFDGFDVLQIVSQCDAVLAEDDEVIGIESERLFDRVEELFLLSQIFVLERQIKERLAEVLLDFYRSLERGRGFGVFTKLAQSDAEVVVSQLAFTIEFECSV